MRSEADQVDLISFCVGQNFSIRLALADGMLNLTPKMSFCGYRLLQLSRGFVIGAFLAKWIPGNLRLVQRERRYHVQEMQLRLILLRER